MAAKRTVAIFANYAATEKTLCAMYLAAHIIRRYRYVVWVVPEDTTQQIKYAGFSHQWDAEILSLKSKAKEIKERLSKCEICFFFEENEQLYSLLPSTTKTAVFLDPYTWDHNTSRTFAKKCTYALSTSPSITEKIVKKNLLTNELLCPFDPIVQLASKAGFRSGEATSLLYNAYGMSFLERQCLWKISEIVKACCPDSKSVLCYYNAKDIPVSGRDSRTYDWKLLNYLKQADWIIDISPRPLLGFFPAFAGTLGLQWSGFDIPPNTDQYHAARRHLVSYPGGGLANADAEAIAGQIVRQLTTTFNDDLERHRGAGAHEERLIKFTRSINQMLGVKGAKAPL